MWSSEPFLSHDDLRVVYDRIGRGQDTQAFYEDPALDALISHSDFGDARSIFEVGCGTGRLAERLLRKECSSTARYRGVDLSSRMVEIARGRLAPFGDRAEVCLTDGEFAFALDDRSQDRVVATYVLDLLPEDDIRALLEEAHRLLDSTGRLCLAGLTTGERVIGRVVSSLWSTVHSIQPAWVGGCRPLQMRPFLEGARWDVLHHSVVQAWGVPSEVVVAVPEQSH